MSINRRRYGTLVAFGCVALALAGPVTAQDQPKSLPSARSSAPTEVLAIEARLMRDVVARDQANVLATIAELSPMLGRQFGDPAVVRNQFTMTISYFGQPSDWEMVHEVKVGSSVITRYYVVRHERGVVIWRLTYVKATAGWMLASFLFNDQLDNWVSTFTKKSEN